jgi:hypothetical protein
LYESANDPQLREGRYIFGAGQVVPPTDVHARITDNVASINRRLRSRARQASLEVHARSRQLIREVSRRVIVGDYVALRVLEEHSNRARDAPH